MKNETNYKLIKRPKKDFEKAINSFLKNEKGKFGKYFSLGNALVYRTIITTEYGESQKVGQDIIARKINGSIVGNSSILPLIGRSVSFGNERLNSSITEVQEKLGQIVTMIPFSVFEEANLDLNQFEILERGKEEEVIRKIDNPKYKSWEEEDMEKKGILEFIDENIHFTGASLFRVENAYYLFDIDREELKHKIFNPFLVKLPNEVETIKAAYDSLIPEEVKGQKGVIRQGEFFYIPVKIDKAFLEKQEVFGEEDNIELNTYSSRTFKIQAGNNRPNIAQIGFNCNGNAFIKGIVRHSGREHRDVKLKNWYKVVPNTAIDSFTIEGDID